MRLALVEGSHLNVIHSNNDGEGAAEPAAGGQLNRQLGETGPAAAGPAAGGNWAGSWAGNAQAAAGLRHPGRCPWRAAPASRARLACFALRDCFEFPMKRVCNTALLL